MRVSAYESTDSIELVNMWRASFEFAVGIKDPNPIQDQLNFFLREVISQNKVRVAKRENVIVGFLASAPDSVSHLYVRVQNIGQGVGAHLLGLAKLESEGSLWLYTFAQNTNARRFYERHGFKEASRRLSAGHRTCTNWKPSGTSGCGARVRPNTSFKRSANGRPPGPGRWYAVHFHRPGPGVLPSSPA